MTRAQRDETAVVVDALVPPSVSEGRSLDDDGAIQANTKLRRDLLHHAVGRAVRDHRRRQELSKQELAATAGVSIGMLSRIENATVSPSLQTLRAIAAALAMRVSGFFESYDENPKALFTKRSSDIDREWHKNFATFQQKRSAYEAKATQVELVDPSDEFFIFPQEGVLFIHVLEGGFTYRHGRWHLSRSLSSVWPRSAVRLLPILLFSSCSARCKLRLAPAFAWLLSPSGKHRTGMTGRAGWAMRRWHGPWRLCSVLPWEGRWMNSWGGERSLSFSRPLAQSSCLYRNEN